MPDDITAIIYTSGTTGPPKGVIDTNMGIIRNMHEYTSIFPLDENDRGVSFLPMAHALELRNGHWLHVIYGFTQVYAGCNVTFTGLSGTFQLHGRKNQILAVGVDDVEIEPALQAVAKLLSHGALHLAATQGA